jgi:hypothetical protein
MPYVIYNKETKYILRARARSVGCYIENYKTESAAKAALTRLTKAGNLGKKRPNRPWLKEDFAIAELFDFRENIEPMVERRDALTGEKFMERLNANYATSRASENYYCS